jgi:hypothetical protein
MSNLLAGPVDFGATFGLYLLLVLVVIPGLAIAGVGLLLLALIRHLRARREVTYDDRARRRTKWFAIAGALMCLPIAAFIGNELWSHRQAIELQEKYLVNLDFDIYEPTVVPPGYQTQGDVNTFREPPYIDYYMTDGLHVTEFEYTDEVQPFLDPDGACDPGAALMYLTLYGGPSQPDPASVSTPCRRQITTPGDRVLYGNGIPDPSSNEVMFTVFGDTAVVFEFSFMYQGDKSELPALVDSMRPIEPVSLKGQ